MALRLLMLGPPGAGKGTQAARIAGDHGVPKISTGDMLRDAVASGSSLGHLVKETVARGALVSDDVIVALVRERLREPDAAGGYVLDGFPRTVTQAEALDGLLNGGAAGGGRDSGAGRRAGAAGARAPDLRALRHHGVGLRRRSVAAQACQACGGRLVQRSDDSEQVVRDRLKVYWRETQPMIELLRGAADVPPRRRRAAAGGGVPGHRRGHRRDGREGVAQ